MKRVCLIMLLLFSANVTFAQEKPLFGPEKYDVKERYGLDNPYPVKVSVPEGLYLLKIQNGVTPAERVDLLSLTLNGAAVIPERSSEYRFFACFVSLRSENTLTLSIKDFKPTGFKRPPPIPKNVTLTILPAPAKVPGGVLGLSSWEGLTSYTNALLNIKSSESFSLALAASNFGSEPAARAAAMRQLADRKDPEAQALILHLFNDYADDPAVRGEAALALGLLGDKASIPSLIQGVFDPDDQIRVGAVRALSFLKEEDTREPLAKALNRMDQLMRDAAVRSIVSAGWKPVSLLSEMAESKDPTVANSGVEMMIGLRDERAVDLMLKYLDKPGIHDLRLVIAVLGGAKNKKAVESLTKVARDPAKRKGLEADLGVALASIGDPASAPVIAELIKSTESQRARTKLQEAYKTLTGTEHK